MASKLEQYLSYRTTLGYTNRVPRVAFYAFDHYLTKNKIDKHELFQPSFFLEFRKNMKQDPKTINKFFSALRGFFQFLVRHDYYEQNPLQDIPPLPERAFVPFVLSPLQIDQLLAAISKDIRKTPRYLIFDMAVYLVIVLLARCGMRISEPLRILKSHYRPEEGTIYIEKTKFKKDRLIPVPKAVLMEIENYLAVRNTLTPLDQNPFLFAGRKQKGLTRYHICPVFQKALKDIGLDRQRKILGDITFGAPNPHSLRHSFAINTLNGIKKRGKSPQHALPVLATYMGHARFQYTGAYLKVSDPKDVQGLIDFSKSQLDVI